MPLFFIRFARASVLAVSLFFLFGSLVYPPSAWAQPPAIPLANVYHPGVNLKDYWVSEKLDGVRAYWDGEQLWSRGGHVYAAPVWFTKHFPKQPLDGELWSGRGRFAELSGVVRKHQPVDAEWQQVRFQVFDLPMQSAAFELRYQRLTALVQAAGSPYLALVSQSPVASHDALLEQLHAMVAAGGEGLMLKRKAGLYQAGRSDDLLKVTTHDDAEAVVVRHLPGKGRLEGMMGALEVKLADGRQFRIGTGFSDTQRRQPPPVGATVTFRYRGLTATGLPRFARFLRVRNDDPEFAPAPFH
ncbi:DNA ligase [Marinobacter halophilus]|uniref:DNA ligase n=1 Tax=Marinobacter halophilus TaxID=1323740 RepID=A0A2T1KFL4_9GAMM|nr:DNA ligase [Marinobacter halophilus]PSF08917.1 DNA ligase [Marinobacter halophilus]GGC65093.1 ATP-dependent DNA ligase [Marinobacter halophilus]